MEIKSYSEIYFEPLIDFLRKSWAENHSIYEKQLFDWQYGGCMGDSSACLLLLDNNNEIQGFLGTVSYPFMVNDSVSNAAALSIWVVDKNIRSSGAGKNLKKTVEDRFHIVYAIGMNPATIRYYENHGYSYHNSLHRYVLPLDTECFKLFLIDSDRTDEGKVMGWFDSIRFSEPTAPSTDFNSDILAEIYQRNVAPHFLVRPKKDAAFWEWRYIKSKGFKYLFHETEDNVVIFRIENTYSPGDLLKHDRKCLRIIEILPNDGNVWNGKPNKDLAETLQTVLTWAKEQGCILADFQISNSGLGHVLEEVGFRIQSEDNVTNLTRLFSPLRPDAAPLNFAYRIKNHAGEILNVDREDTYILKSDSDMDRPNYLG